MAELSTPSPTKRASANTNSTSQRAVRKREPLSVDALANITGVLINEAINGGFSVRVGKTKAGGLLLAIDALTVDDAGVVVPIAPATDAQRENVAA